MENIIWRYGECNLENWQIAQNTHYKFTLKSNKTWRARRFYNFSSELQFCDCTCKSNVAGVCGQNNP